MKYFRQDLLTLLVGLFIFSSCQKSDLVGLDGNTDNQSATTSISVNAFTVKEDSVIVTSGLSQHPFGFLIDPKIGTTKAELALALSLPSEGFSFGSNPTLDSAVLVLKYGNEFYGDSTGYSINVHQLTDEFSLTSNYSNKKEWAHSSDAKEETGQPLKHYSWRDSVFVRQIVKGAPDTLKKIAPHVRIRLDGFVKEKFIEKATASNFATSAAFNTYIKGLFLKQNEPSAKGGIIFFDLQTAGVSRLEIYYKNTNATDATVRDRNMVAFNISGTNASSTIAHTYTAAVKTQLDNPNQLFNTNYVQPMAGLRTKIKFPELAKLKQLGATSIDKNGIISINKAELVVPVDYDPLLDPLAPAPRLGLYRTDIAGVRKAIPDNAIGQDVRALPEVFFDGFYDATNKQYKFVVTSYIQDLLSGEIKEYDTFIAPINKAFTGAANISATATTAKRSILAGTNSSKKIQLNIIYTKPD